MTPMLILNGTYSFPSQCFTLNLFVESLRIFFYLACQLYVVCPLSLPDSVLARPPTLLILIQCLTGSQLPESDMCLISPDQSIIISRQLGVPKVAPHALVEGEGYCRCL